MYIIVLSFLLLFTPLSLRSEVKQNSVYNTVSVVNIEQNLPTERPFFIISPKKHKKPIIFIKKSDLEETPSYHFSSYLELFSRRSQPIKIQSVNPIFIKGHIRKISLWVHGFKKREALYINIKDIKGELHRLSLGFLDFYGWKRLQIHLPSTIRQRKSSIVGGESGIYLDGFFIKPATSIKLTANPLKMYFGEIKAEMREDFKLISPPPSPSL